MCKNNIQIEKMNCVALLCESEKVADKICKVYSKLDRLALEDEKIAYTIDRLTEFHPVVASLRKLEGYQRNLRKAIKGRGL